MNPVNWTLNHILEVIFCLILLYMMPTMWRFIVKWAKKFKADDIKNKGKDNLFGRESER